MVMQHEPMSPWARVPAGLLTRTWDERQRPSEPASLTLQESPALAAAREALLGPIQEPGPASEVALQGWQLRGQKEATGVFAEFKGSQRSLPSPGSLDTFFIPP